MLTERSAKLNSMFKGKIKYNEKLSKHTTIKTGGITPVWFIPKDVDDLSKFLMYANSIGLKTTVLGNGSNVIIKDKKIDFVFINLSSPYFKKIYSRGNIVIVRAGVELKDLIGYCTMRSLSGLEYFTLIPATIGGAVANNIGVAFDNKRYEFLDIIQRIKILDNTTGKLEIYSKHELGFEYHNSNLVYKTIIEVELGLPCQNYNKIQARIDRINRYRQKIHDYSLPSCGCIFKNPTHYRAGKLIQDSGLKGKRIGDAMVSLKHANFILNCGRANSKDILTLIRLVQETVLKNYGIWLEKEVEIIG